MNLAKSKSKEAKKVDFMNRKFVAKSNYVLRKVLNTEDNLDILQDFIEAFLHIKIEKISLNPYLKRKENQLPAEENFGIADLRIETNKKEEKNVGIQFVDGYHVQNKILLYYAQIHSNQLEYDVTRKIVPTVTINLLDFNYFDTKKYHHKILLSSNEDDVNGKTEEMEFHILELPKFLELHPVVSNKEEAWMKFLCGERRDELKLIFSGFSKIKKLDQLLEKYWEEEKME